MIRAYTLHHLFWAAADWLYPPQCAGCGKAGERFCSVCLSEVEKIKVPFCAFCGNEVSQNEAVCFECRTNNIYFDAVASWAVYGGTLREAIHALKYRQDVALGDFFSTYLISILRTRGWVFDLALPVPISPDRMKERGYNQSALLSRPISQFFRVEHSSDSLKRVKETGTQVNRTRLERDKFLEDAFSGNPAKLKDRQVLLVDDIITTGSTINHCAKALKEAGASKVMVISIAKTMKKR